ncbi:MAG: RNA polymerase sigma factor [Actinomycetes bacterium]
MDADSPVADLVRRARDGEQDAWNGLVDRYLPLGLSVARRYGLSGSDAEDVLQTLWLRLVEHLDKIREPEALPGWIATTARNECMRLLRGRQRTATFDPLDDRTYPARVEDDLRVEEHVVDSMGRSDRHQALLQAFAALPDHQRSLLTLLLADPPLSYTEISGRLGIPIGSIGPTRARALQRLRQHPAVAEQISATRATP